jgi:VanZ family protein
VAATRHKTLTGGPGKTLRSFSSISNRYRRPALVAYLLIVAGVTLPPIPDLPYTPRQFDKLVHVVLFAGLAVVVYWNVAAPSWRRRALKALGLSAAVAGLTEVLQALLPFRDADLGDFAAGSLGLLLGLAAAALSGLRRRRARPPGPSVGAGYSGGTDSP